MVAVAESRDWRDSEDWNWRCSEETDWNFGYDLFDWDWSSKVIIGRRRLEFRGTRGRLELEEPLVNSFFFRISLACTRGKPGYRAISASFGILPVITILLECLIIQ